MFLLLLITMQRYNKIFYIVKLFLKYFVLFFFRQKNILHKMLKINDLYLIICLKKYYICIRFGFKTKNTVLQNTPFCLIFNLNN